MVLDTYYDKEKHYTLQYAAVKLHTSKSTITQWIQEGVIPSQIVKYVQKTKNSNQQICVVLREKLDRLVQSGALQEKIESFELTKPVVKVGRLRFTMDEYQRYLEVRNQRRGSSNYSCESNYYDNMINDWANTSDSSSSKLYDSDIWVDELGNDVVN
jgi:hypothetical protein